MLPRRLRFRCSCLPCRSFRRSPKSPTPTSSEHSSDPYLTHQKSKQSQFMPPVAHFTLIARARRRQKVRSKLEHIAKVVSSPHVEHDDALALFSETDCAILTDGGEIIGTKNVSSRPFETIAPKIRAIRATSTALCDYLHQPPLDVVHIRGRSGMVHAYALGNHTLVAITEVSPGARNLDTVVDRIDRCLGVGGAGRTHIEELANMLREF